MIAGLTSEGWVSLSLGVLTLGVLIIYALIYWETRKTYRVISSSALLQFISYVLENYVPRLQQIYSDARNANDKLIKDMEKRDIDDLILIGKLYSEEQYRPLRKMILELETLGAFLRLGWDEYPEEIKKSLALSIRQWVEPFENLISERDKLFSNAYWIYSSVIPISSDLSE